MNEAVNGDVTGFLLQTKKEEVMMVSNKYKQLYECRLPAQAVRFHHDPAAEGDPPGYTGPDIPHLLSPMHDGQCLVKVGWLPPPRTALDHSCSHIWFTVQTTNVFCSLIKVK